MKAYRIMVEDTRIAQPQELAAEMVSDARAIEYAYRRLEADVRLASVEVWRGSLKLWGHSRVMLRAA